MYTTFKLENTDEIEATVTITLKVKEWKKLAKRLAGGGWPEWELEQSIVGVIGQAEKKICYVPEDKQST